MTLIKLEGVAKSYWRGRERIPVLDGLSLSIEAGEFVALMGPSGSGKTTLLQLMSGIDRADAGTITIGDRDLQKLSESELSSWRASQVGFIFQFYNLMPMLTARQNVELPLLLGRHSKKERSERVATALDIVQLADRASHLPRQLSGGQQQRVAIARAIVAGPRILFADEPTGDLDRKTANEILDMLKLLSGELGKTIVMVTHDEQAAAYASRTLRLDKGELIGAEAPE